MAEDFSRSLPGIAAREDRLRHAASVQATIDAAHYDRVAVALHWTMAAAVAAQFALGWWMLALPDEGGVQRVWFNLHKSIGLLLAGLVLLRLAWRFAHPPPALPSHLSQLQRVGARLTHAGLYGCMLLLPLTGYLGSSFSGYPVRFFGYALPAWGWKWPAAKAVLGAAHLTLTWLLVALVVLHVAAALVHLARGDAVFERMWPPRRKAARTADENQSVHDGGF